MLTLPLSAVHTPDQQVCTSAPPPKLNVALKNTFILHGRYHPGFEPDAELMSKVSDDVAALLSGSQRWSVARKVAELGDTPKL